MKFIIIREYEDGSLKMVSRKSTKEIEWTTCINDAWVSSCKYKSLEYIVNGIMKGGIQGVSIMCVYDTMQDAILAIESCIKSLNKTLDVITFLHTPDTPEEEIAYHYHPTKNDEPLTLYERFIKKIMGRGV